MIGIRIFITLFKVTTANLERTAWSLVLIQLIEVSEVKTVNKVNFICLQKLLLRCNGNKTIVDHAAFAAAPVYGTHV